LNSTWDWEGIREKTGEVKSMKAYAAKVMRLSSKLSPDIILHFLKIRKIYKE
jgi:hypothetical protein